jgi:hypothetical protein
MNGSRRTDNRKQVASAMRTRPHRLDHHTTSACGFAWRYSPVSRRCAQACRGWRGRPGRHVRPVLPRFACGQARVRGLGYREIVLNYVARMSRGESIPAPPLIAPVSPADQELYAGTYELSDSGTVEIWTSGESLLIGARDAAGLSVLAGHSADQARRAQSVGAHTRRFLGRLENDSLAMEFLHASIPADSRRAYLVRMRRVMGDSIDARVSVIGTAVDSPIGARSYVRIRRRGRVARVEWREARRRGAVGSRGVHARPPWRRRRRADVVRFVHGASRPRLAYCGARGGNRVGRNRTARTALGSAPRASAAQLRTARHAKLWQKSSLGATRSATAPIAFDIAYSGAPMRPRTP